MYTLQQCSPHAATSQEMQLHAKRITTGLPHKCSAKRHCATPISGREPTCGPEQQHIALLQLHLIVTLTAKEVRLTSAILRLVEPAQRRPLVNARVAMAVPAAA